MANVEHNPFPQSNSNKLFHFGNKVISFHLTSTSKWLLELALSIYIAITLTIVLAISFALGICMLYIYYSAWYRIVFLAVGSCFSFCEWHEWISVFPAAKAAVAHLVFNLECTHGTSLCVFALEIKRNDNNSANGCFRSRGPMHIAFNLDNLVASIIDLIKVHQKFIKLRRVSDTA